MEWIWITLAVVGAIIAATLITGALLPRAHVAAHTALLKGTPEALWEIITDIDAYPKWRSDLDSVRLLAGDGNLATWEETGRWGVVTMERIEAVAPSRMVVRIAGNERAFGGSWTYELRPEAGGTRVVVTERGEIHNIVFRVMARFVFGFTATIDAWLRDLGRRLGQDVTPAGE